MAPGLQLGEDGNVPWQLKWSLVMAPSWKKKKKQSWVSGVVVGFCVCICQIHFALFIVYQK